MTNLCTPVSNSASNRASARASSATSAPATSPATTPASNSACTAPVALYAPAPEAASAKDVSLPCQQRQVADLFFSERPADLEQAKSLCADCPLRSACLEGALQRAEPWGVWGGAIFDAGQVIAVKRGRGRPRKNQAA